MRFYHHRPIAGETRTKSIFAFLPIRIGRETRWLEKVKVFQVARRYVIHSDIGSDEIKIKWENLDFVD